MTAFDGWGTEIPTERHAPSQRREPDEDRALPVVAVAVVLLVGVLVGVTIGLVMAAEDRHEIALAAEAERMSSADERPSAQVERCAP